MSQPKSATENQIMVAVMGATGTGKSAFIRHLTNDPKIRVSNSINSETSEIQTSCYKDAETGHSVMLIDTPGFDDSREHITDTDILQKIIDFLEPMRGERKKLNGIIYMYRITDNRMGNMARKNLRMFEALCGEKSFCRVRIVTTHWDEDHKIGSARESEMKNGFLKSLLEYGAKMHRHSNTAESAQAIMAELIQLSGVTTQIQEEVAEDIPLGETRAGIVLDAYIEQLRKKYHEELAELQKEMEQTILGQRPIAELKEEEEILEGRLMRAEEDQSRLGMTRPQLLEQQKKVDEIMKKLRAALAQKAEEVRKAQNEASKKVKKLEEELAELGHLNTEAERYARLGVFRRLLNFWDTRVVKLVTKMLKRGRGHRRASRQQADSAARPHFVGAKG